MTWPCYLVSLLGTKEPGNTLCSYTDTLYSFLSFPVCKWNIQEILFRLDLKNRHWIWTKWTAVWVTRVLCKGQQPSPSFPGNLKRANLSGVWQSHWATKDALFFRCGKRGPEKASDYTQLHRKWMVLGSRGVWPPAAELFAFYHRASFNYKPTEIDQISSSPCSWGAEHLKHFDSASQRVSWWQFITAKGKFREVTGYYVLGPQPDRWPHGIGRVTLLPLDSL